MGAALLKLLNRPSALALLARFVVASSTPAASASLSFDTRRCYGCQTQRRQHTRAAISNKGSFTTGRRLRNGKTQGEGTNGQHATRSSNSAQEVPAIFRSEQPPELERGTGKSPSDLLNRKGYLPSLVEQLRYQQRHFGDQGTIKTWQALMASKQDMPVEGREADILWEAFVAAGLRRKDFLEKLCVHANELRRRTGQRWGRLYQEVVGGLLRTDPDASYHYHFLLAEMHLPDPDRLGDIFPIEFLNQARLRAFKQLCSATEGHQIYDTVISRLLEMNQLPTAVSMHIFLLGRDDRPRDPALVNPLLQYVEKHRSGRFYDEFRTMSLEPRRAGEPPTQKTSSTSMRIGLDHSDNPSSRKKSVKEMPKLASIKKSSLNDDFGAKLFATRAFSLHFIISGLKMFDIDSIGPLTLREMAFKCRDAEDIHNKILELEGMGISVGQSVFSRVVHKLAADGNATILADVLDSDQHPDVLEDRSLQEEFLASYYATQDWRQFNRTMAILSIGSNGYQRAWNSLLRRCFTSGDWTPSLRLMDDMRINRVDIDNTNRNLMLQQVLQPRHPGQKPTLERIQFAELRTMIKVWQTFVESGRSIPAEAWNQVLKAIGMAGHWYELQKLMLWLVQQYGPVVSDEQAFASVIKQSPEENRDRRLPASHPDSMLNTIFSVPMQKAIVHWGFQARPPRNAAEVASGPEKKQGDKKEVLSSWVRGLVLLRQLRDRGVRVPKPLVVKAFRQRLAILYGPARSSNKPMNRMLRRENPWTLEKIIADAKKVWGESFLGDLEQDLDQLVNPRQKKHEYGSRSKSRTEGSIRPECVHEIC